MIRSVKTHVDYLQYDFCTGLLLDKQTCTALVLFHLDT